MSNNPHLLGLPPVLPFSLLFAGVLEPLCTHSNIDIYVCTQDERERAKIRWYPATSSPHSSQLRMKDKSKRLFSMFFKKSFNRSQIYLQTILEFTSTILLQYF